MAFVSLKQKELQKILAICNQVSLKTSDVDVFTYTKVCIRKEEVELSSFNSTLFFKSSLAPANIDGEVEAIEFLVKTDLFTNSVNLIKDEVISLTIDLQKTTLLLQSSTSKHTLRINLDQLENFVTPERKSDGIQTKLTVDSSNLLTANRVAQIAVGNPRTVYQPEFLNICYTLLLSEGKMAVVSTDRYRMVKVILEVKDEHTIEDLKTKPQNFLLNPKNLNIIGALVSDLEPAELTFEKDSLWIKSQANEVVMRYGDGTYPEYNKILPQSFACSFLINSKDTLEALKQVFYLARMNTNNKSMTIQVDPQKKQLTFSAATGDGYSSESSVSLLEYEGSEDSWTQSFNAEYLIDYITNSTAERLLWEANPSKPSVLSPENEKNKQLYLVSGLK